MASIDPNDNALFRDKEKIPDHYWQDLGLMDPQDVCRRALVTFQPGTGYQVPFWNRVYLCRPDSTRIWQADRPDKPLGFQEYLVILMYLLKAQESPLEGKKVSEREIPGGELFFRGPHALVKKPLGKKFGQDPKGFLQAGLGLGGRETGKGDASFELLVLPRIPVEYILYVEDEEFPAQVNINFDSSIGRHLPLDVIWALVNLTGWYLVPR